MTFSIMKSIMKRMDRATPIVMKTELYGAAAGIGGAGAAVAVAVVFATVAQAAGEKAHGKVIPGVQDAAAPLLMAAKASTDKRALTPAKVLFGKRRAPANLRARAFGTYNRGCLAGAKAMAINGRSWQVMRLSRNRNWGHPTLIAYLEKLANDVTTKDRWPGLLIGDLAQPRGGPMLSGHASHQLGLDADIWLMPMPGRELSRTEREKMTAMSMLRKDKKRINHRVWKPGHVRIIKRAASDPRVARIFVHPVIKRELCRASKGEKRPWLRKVRPWWGHHYHFHVRLKCPPGSGNCRNQNAPPAGDGCGAEISLWLKRMFGPKPKVKKKPTPPPKKRIVTVNDLPKQCRTVLYAN